MIPTDRTNTERDDYAVLQKVTLPQACNEFAQCCLQDGNWKPNQAPGQPGYSKGFRLTNSYKLYIFIKTKVYANWIHMHLYIRYMENEFASVHVFEPIDF